MGGGWVLVWIFISAGSVDGSSTDMGGGVSIGTQRFATEEGCVEAQNFVTGGPPGSSTARSLPPAKYVNATCVFDEAMIEVHSIPNMDLLERLKQ
jgi:hypothetical protein